MKEKEKLLLILFVLHTLKYTNIPCLDIVMQWVV